LPSVTPEEAWSGRRPCVAHMRVFGSIAYARVPDEKRGKVDAQGIKCIFLGYYEGMKAYRLMCMETKKIIKSRDVVFMENSGSIRNDLEMRPSGRYEGPSLVEVDESSKSPLFDGGGELTECNEQVGGSGVGSEELDEGPTNEVVVVEGFGEERRYPRRERRPLGEWWRNHILPQHGEERANVAICEGTLNWKESFRRNMSKLMCNVRTSLDRVEKLRNAIELHFFDYSQSGSVEGRALGCS